MPVDPTKQRKILVVHGVQTKTNADINPHKRIQELVESRSPVSLDFKSEIYKYEDFNDAAATKKLNKVLDGFAKPLLNKIPLGNVASAVVSSGVDLVGDVVLALKNGSTAQRIREGLIERIEDYYDRGHPLYIVAHSLGSVYAFDAVNQLVRDRRYFDRDNRKTWPVQGMVTLGSPLGLRMFRRNKIRSLGPGRKYLRWVNIWARTDPVVSGSFYGKPQQGYEIVERFTVRDAQGDPVDEGWFIKDRVVDTGKTWLMAHVAYWDDPAVGDDLSTMISS